MNNILANYINTPRLSSAALLPESNRIAGAFVTNGKHRAHALLNHIVKMAAAANGELSIASVTMNASNEELLQAKLASPNLHPFPSVDLTPKCPSLCLHQRHPPLC